MKLANHVNNNAIKFVMIKIINNKDVLLVKTK